MALIGSQSDRHGNLVPAGGGIVVINRDGSTLPQRHTIFLGNSLVGTDDPDSAAIRLDVNERHSMRRSADASVAIHSVNGLFELAETGKVFIFSGSKAIRGISVSIDWRRITAIVEAGTLLSEMESALPDGFSPLALRNSTDLTTSRLSVFDLIYDGKAWRQYE